jgi:hypothetical protein
MPESSNPVVGQGQGPSTNRRLCGAVCAGDRRRRGRKVRPGGCRDRVDGYVETKEQERHEFTRNVHHPSR